MKRLPKLWRSATASIILSYGLFFGLWALMLLVLVYWEAAGYLSGEAERQLEERAQYFSSIDPALLPQRLADVYAFDSQQINSYGLFDPAGRPLAGHLDRLPEKLQLDGQAHIYPRRSAKGQTVSTRILAVRLRNGDQLLLARNAGLIDEVHRLFLRAVAWGLSLTLVPGVLGGIVLIIRPLRRIRELQAVSERVMAGDLHERLPVSGRDDELDRLAGIVNRMLDRIERLMGEIKSVGDNIAHDLRTPLTHLRAQLYRLQQQMPDGDERAELVDQAVDETDELMARFAALLRIAELKDEHRRAAFAEVDLNEVLEQVYDLYEPLAEEKAIHFTLHAPALAPIRGDRQLLIEAFSNLMANAIKFTPERGRIQIQASQQAEGPMVTVADSGPGIPASQRQAVFRRFYRVDQGRSTPGFGLGLSIVEAIVQLHGYQVEACDVPEGACLAIRFWPSAAAG